MGFQMSRRDDFGHIPPFKIINCPDVSSVPWGLAEQARFSLQINHDMSPERLNEGGGVTAASFMAALRGWTLTDKRMDGRPWGKELAAEVRAYNRKHGVK